MSATPLPVTAIHKSEAVYCENCGCFVNRQISGLCGHCESTAVMNAEAIVDGNPIPNEWLTAKDPEFMGLEETHEPEVQA